MGWKCKESQGCTPYMHGVCARRAQFMISKLHERAHLNPDRTPLQSGIPAVSLLQGMEEIRR